MEKAFGPFFFYKASLATELTNKVRCGGRPGEERIKGDMDWN